MATRIKFCGCTSVHDAKLALAAGADAIGVIFAEASPRRVSMEIAHEIAQAIPAFVTLVGVFVDPPESLVEEALKSGYVPQFSGTEDALSCESFAAGQYLKAFHLPVDGGVDPAVFGAQANAFTHATWLFDTSVAGLQGGTGTTFDWDVARRLAHERPFVMSGGLTPENVGDCVRRTRPYAVDVRSGIETGGVKDVDKMRAFVRAVKEADAEA